MIRNKSISHLLTDLEFSVLVRLEKTQFVCSSELLTCNLPDCWGVSVDHYHWQDTEIATVDQAVTVLVLEEANIAQ